MFKNLATRLLGALLAIILWLVVVFIGFSEGWLKRPLTQDATPEAFMRAAEAFIEKEKPGNLAFILIEDGEAAGAHYSSRGKPVGPDSLFQVASLSKWITAWGVMVLVQDGAIDLDAPVSDYLTRWSLPPSHYDEAGVTTRRLLSHMAGLDDGLGYQGFATASAVQSLEASLTQAADASPGANGAVRIGHAPGRDWAYSGGGYTLLQLLIEEVSGQRFTAFMKERVFDPLGMTRTTFDHDEADALGLAENFTVDGSSEPLRRYTALAAASAYTSAGDMLLFAQAHMKARQPAGGGVLSGDVLTAMQTPHAAALGADIWGLGLMLYAPNGEGGFIIGHDGNNEPAINTATRIDPATGDGIVLLGTGAPLLATRLAGEWVFWKTGEIDNLTFSLEAGGAIRLAAIGVAIIALSAGSSLWRARRRARRRG